MNVTPTAGIAAAWSAAKSSPADRAAQQASQGEPSKKTAEDSPPEAKKGPPPAEGQGTRVDVRV